MSGIYWLASYPKSGNTWLRIFLNNLLSDKDRPSDINELEHIWIPIASVRYMFDELVGYDSSDLTMDEVDALRPELYSTLAKFDNKIKYLKIHDAYTETKTGKELIPREGSLGAVYIIRNPLDVAVSFANHSNSSIDKTISKMCRADNSFCEKNDIINIQLRQKLLSWSGHVKSWTEQKNIPVKVIRYEDMLNNAYETFKSVVEFLELGNRMGRLEKAIAFSDFKILKQQEQESGFREKPLKSKSFFREGKTGYWEKHITDEQVKTIIDSHKEIMQKYGYLTQDGTITQ